MEETRGESTSGLVPKTIVVCEDDPEIRDLLTAFLAGEGFDVASATDGDELDRLLAVKTPDLLILDWMLPGEDGLSICRRMQAQGGPPVLMLTARDGDADQVDGLETGADAYITKPFNPRILLAHIRAALRRTGRSPATAVRLRVADIALDVGARKVLHEDRELPLTAAEFDLLLCFATRPQRVLSRDTLMEITRGRAPGAVDRTIDVQVSRLRHRLKAAGSLTADLIKAVRNAGYILSAPAERDEILQ